ncbi:MAG: hypothetical protein V2A79_20135 [Planctomycetota bacterium]
MELRKALLLGMLWSLGFAAATGVLGLLFSGGGAVWRVVGTGALTAVACGLMIPVSGMIDRQVSRGAGLLGMAAILVEYFMVLALLWQLVDVLFSASGKESFALTAVFLGLTAPVAGVLLRMTTIARTARAGRVGLVLCGVVFIALMVGTWGPVSKWTSTYSYASDSWERREHWWETASALAIFGALTVAGLVDVDMGERRPWRWAGVFASGAAGPMWLVRIWMGAGSALGTAIFSTLTCMAAVVAHANLCWLCPLTVGQNWVRLGTVAAATVTAALIDLWVIDDLFHLYLGSGYLERLIPAAGIVAACGTLAICVLVRLNRNVDFEPVTVETLEMTVICPRCRKKQQIPLGDAACSACQLRIHIRIEEPRCLQCGFLLYRLTSDRCPECGTPLGMNPPTHQDPPVV